MLSIANYGSSDSENEISDDEPEIFPSTKTNESREEEDDFLQKPSSINLPQPSIKKVLITEEDDEFLHKKEVSKVNPPTKTKVKITIPRLSDFKDDDDEKNKQKKVLPANKRAGLLGMLPKPSNSFIISPKPSSVPVEQKKPVPAKLIEKQVISSETPKKVGLIPYSLMSHKPKTTESQKPSKSNDQDSDDDSEDVGSFFTFTNNDDDELPKVSEEEVKVLVAKESARMEQRKRQHDEVETNRLAEQLNDSQVEIVHQQQEEIDEEAMKALLGGNKAKRSKIDNIQFINLSAAEVMPNRDEWLRKSLAGETSYQPTGHISEKVCSFARFLSNSSDISLF